MFTLLGAICVAAQTRPDWRKIGTSAVELMLASPATGSVDRVWFSADGSQLFARTSSGKTFVSVDFETWVPAAAAAPAAPLNEITAARLPDSTARIVTSAADPLRLYALGRNLSRSEDGGRSWTSLTQFKSESIIGSGQHSLAVSPTDPDQLVVANDYGVWRSLDGGLSWAGLNQFLPNLPVRRILSTPGGTAGIRVEADRVGVLELPPGGAVWFVASGPGSQTEAALRQRYSAALGAAITAVSTSGDTVYAGSSDGRIWVSFDRGATFRQSRFETGGAVERVFVDSSAPRVALAVLSGPGARVLRTTSNGTIWDDLTANLPDGSVHAVTAERASGAVYVATDRGVFWTRTDLESASLPAANWTNLTERLPAAPATDVRLDPAGVQLYIALDGYGVYATAAPHRQRNLRIVNTADYSTRSAAPGSLVTVIGGRVNSARGGGLDYPVLATSDGESQLQVPFDATGSNVSLALQTNNGQIMLGLPLQPLSPAIIVGRDGVPLLLDADSGLPLDARNTAHSNGRIQILATGLGKVRPEWPAGLAAPPENTPVVAADVKVYLDGASLPVTRASLAPSYVGFYLIEAQLPAVANLGTSELYVSAGGQESNRVQIVLGP
ncbi:MAG TPA: hypothetical protein VGF16_19880 [Bryobacteraceae bacterium]|jgi:uncharacterized protein (TIGR03437 family)